MERRFFLKSMLGVAAALVAPALIGAEEARAMPVANALADVDTSAAVATPEDIEGAKVENVRWIYRRRVFYRRRFYRRRFYRRRFYRRRVYYRRPVYYYRRPVYYYRPRRVFFF